MPHQSELCPLCDHSSPEFHAQTTYSFGDRSWWHCSHCDLVFVGPGDLPSAAAEAAEYLLHNNSIDDPGYVAFLDTLIDPMIAALPAGATGLDYGSGPVPVLAQLMERRGFAMAVFDFQFSPDRSVFDATYDFVTSSEVFEHFHTPRIDIARIFDILKPGGKLGVMTSLRDPDQNFLDWYYIREESHVCFYSAKTMAWIAQRWGLTVLQCDAKVTIFERSPSPLNRRSGT